MSKPNNEGKALGLTARDYTKVSTAVDKLEAALRALKTLEEISGPAADLRKDCEEVLGQCNEFRSRFFGAGASDPTGII